MENLFLQNIFYCTLFVISGLLILKALKTMRLRHARIFFLALFIACLIYIPYYFFGNAVMYIFSGIFKTEYASRIFISIMSGMLNAPFIYFKTITVGAFCYALVSGTAAFVFAVWFAVKLVHYVRELHFISAPARECAQAYGAPSISYIKNHRNTYKFLLKLRN